MPFEHKMRRKRYLLDVAIWLAVFGAVLAAMWEIGVWLVAHWSSPGLP